MSFLGLELNLGLSLSFAIAILAVLWNYSDLPEINWAEITAGVMAFLAGAGLQVLGGSSALGAFATVGGIDSLVALLNLMGGLLVLVGGLLNGVRLLQDNWM